MIRNTAAVLARDGPNQPELRAQLIYEELLTRFAGAGAVVLENEEEATLEELSEIHSTLFLRFLKGAHASAVAAQDKFLLKEQALVPLTYWTGSREDVPTLSATLPLYLQSSLFVRDFMSPIFATTWPSVSLSAGNTLKAARLLQPAAPEAAGKVVYALNSSPGHHASKDGELPLFDIHGPFAHSCLSQPSLAIVSCACYILSLPCSHEVIFF